MTRHPLDPLNAAQVRKALKGISGRTLQRLIRTGEFPMAFKIGGQANVWYRMDVMAYLWIRQARKRMYPEQNHGQRKANSRQAGRLTGDKRKLNGKTT